MNDYGRFKELAMRFFLQRQHGADVWRNGPHEYRASGKHVSAPYVSDSRSFVTTALGPLHTFQRRAGALQM